jgi:hypothetical protein
MLHIKRAENLLDLMDQDAQTHREISEIRIFSEARLTHYPQKDADSFLSKCSTLREQELAGFDGSRCTNPPIFCTFNNGV